MPTRVETVKCDCGRTFRSKLRRGKTTTPCPGCGKNVVVTEDNCVEDPRR